ncbi:endonuclease III [Acetobacter fallax]|uniref:Endonuclease III n=1 Tax=Acetobacter fallax TaxID=1737473 RepID=A0ABX0K7V9_9PROT|nr:endonuclease III [Acetobacter fallax]NHO35885.1 endonuclease III [Acetobacter fallax]
MPDTNPPLVPKAAPSPRRKTTATKPPQKRKPKAATHAPNGTANAPRNMTKPEIAGFLADLARTWPDARTELKFETPFQLLIATALAAQATDASVNRVTPALFAVAPGPAEMAKLSVDDVGNYIRTIGLWRNKAKNVVALSQALVDRFGSEVPADRDALESLPGVGRKTAAVVLNVAFGQAAVPVDTHAFRLANRTGLARGKTVLDVERGLEARIPADLLRESHHWLILQGRYVCKARRPECWRCAATRNCLYPEKELIPPRRAKS